MKNMEEDLLVSYTPEWNEKFVEEKNELLNEIQEEGVRIEHIGSTSVVGMEAVPIIDMMIGLTEFDKGIKRVRRVLEAKGYREMLNYLELTERCLFVKEDDSGARTFSAHVIKANGRLWRKKLEMKRLLSDSEAARKDYIEFKRKSIEYCGGNLEEYYKLKENYFSKK